MDIYVPWYRLHLSNNADLFIEMLKTQSLCCILWNKAVIVISNVPGGPLRNNGVLTTAFLLKKTLANNGRMKIAISSN